MGSIISCFQVYNYYPKLLIKINDELLACVGNNIKIFNFHIGEMIKSIENCSNHGVRVILKYGDKFLTASSKDCVRIWDIDLVDRIKGHTSEITFLLKVNQSIVASGSNDKTIKIWYFPSGKLLRTLYGHTESIFKMCKLCDYKIASTAGRIIKIWDLRNVKSISTLDNHQETVTDIGLWNNEDFISCSSDNILKLWKNHKCVKSISGIQMVIDGVVSRIGIISIACVNEYLIASIDMEEVIRVWNINTESLAYNLVGHSELIMCIKKWKDGYLISAGLDNHIKLWDVLKSECIIDLKNSTSICGLTLMNEKEIGSFYNTSIKIWNIDLSKCVREISIYSTNACLYIE